ncbi:hypothetical protein OC842_005547, partial [Tilletia horrida]
MSKDGTLEACDAISVIFKRYRQPPPTSPLSQMTNQSRAKPPLASLVRDSNAAVDVAAKEYDQSVAASHSKTWDHPMYTLGQDWHRLLAGQSESDTGVYSSERFSLGQAPGLQVMWEHRTERVNIATLSTFKVRLQELHHGMLEGVILGNGVVIAGEAVLACLLEDPGSLQAYADCGLDLVLYGSTSRQATIRLGQIEQVLRRNVPNFDTYVEIVRTANDVTFRPTCQAPSTLRLLRISLCAHRSLAEIAEMFEVSPARVFFDGKDVFFCAAAARSIAIGMIVADATIRGISTSTVLRYAARGFAWSILGEDEQTNIFVHASIKNTNAKFGQLLRAGSGGRNTIDIVRRWMGGQVAQWSYGLSAFARLVPLWTYLRGAEEDVQCLFQATAEIHSAYLRDIQTSHEGLPALYLKYVNAFSSMGFWATGVDVKNVSELKTAAGVPLCIERTSVPTDRMVISV